jgi:hypothetical protein
MNDVTLLREAGPAAPSLRPETVHAARAALLEEIERSQTLRGRARARLPRRRTALRVGAGVTVAAVAWTAAAVVAAPDELGPPPGSITLVAFEMPTFPLSLDPAPEGLEPAFEGDGEGASIAGYHDPEMREGFTIFVSEDEPERLADLAGTRIGEVQEARVAGEDAEVVHGSENWCWGPDGADECAPRGFTELRWERAADQWVRIEGHGTYDDEARLVDVAESLVDRPQPVTLAAEVAPAGWSVQFYKMGRVLTLVNDAYDQQTLSVHVPLPDEAIPADQVRESIMGPIGPQLDVSVNGRPAQLVRCRSDYLNREKWYLQAQFEDGTTFVVQAPEAFTQEQVLELAESVTYNP